MAAVSTAISSLTPVRELTVIAWLWVRTVASPDPMLRGTHVPLASSFVLSSKKGNEAWVEPVVSGRNSYRFEVRVGMLPTKAKSGTSAGKRRAFRCLMSDVSLPYEHVRNEGKAGRMGARLMAVVVEGDRGRIYFSPSAEHEVIAREAEPTWKPDFEMPKKHRNFQGPVYGLNYLADLFTDRQLVALTLFSDLVSEAGEKVLADAQAADMDADARGLTDDATRAESYADAVATYLGLAVGKLANRGSNLCVWNKSSPQVDTAFTDQALPMSWDFCEANPFSNSSGNFVGQVGYLANVVAEGTSTAAPVAVIQQDAAGETVLANNAIIATDPPYYDNIGYADLSDFFYVWLRRSLREIWPELFRRVLVPKDEELVATPYRHGSRQAAQTFFMDGIGKALTNMRRSGTDEFPATIYYAFKQSEVAKEGLTSPGWATFLQGLIDAGYLVDGTWPV